MFQRYFIKAPCDVQKVTFAELKLNIFETASKCLGCKRWLYYFVVGAPPPGRKSKLQRNSWFITVCLRLLWLEVHIVKATLRFHKLSVTLCAHKSPSVHSKFKKQYFPLSRMCSLHEKSSGSSFSLRRWQRAQSFQNLVFIGFLKIPLSFWAEFMASASAKSEVWNRLGLSRL